MEENKRQTYLGELDIKKTSESDRIIGLAGNPNVAKAPCSINSPD